RDDAQENAVFAIREAIQKFDAHKPAAWKERPFRHFLFQVLHARFLDFVRSQWRSAKHCRPFSDKRRKVDQGKEPHPLIVWPGEHSGEEGEDPCHLAEEHELLDSLAKELQKLDPAERVVCEYRKAGKSLHQFADDFGIGYEEAKTLWRHVSILL